MSLRPYQQAYDVVIRMMAETLNLPPAVEPYRLADCVNRWREQRIAEVCINEFGDDARAEARRLLQVAEGAPRFLTGPQTGVRSLDCGALSLGSTLAGDAGHSGAVALVTPSVPMTGRRDGACVSGRNIGEAA